MTKQIVRLSLLALIALSACQGAKQQDKQISEQATDVVAERIDQTLLIGSWIDQSEAQLHFSLLENGVARSDNMETLLYEKWKLDGRKLILTITSIGNGNSSTDNETYEIETLTETKLVLRNGDYSFDFRRKE